MLHGLVPTLQPIDAKGTKQQPSKSSSEMPSIAMPKQLVPDSLGAGVPSKRCVSDKDLDGEDKQPGKATEIKKKKALSNKLQTKMKQAEDKLEDLDTLEESIRSSSRLFPACTLKKTSLDRPKAFVMISPYMCVMSMPSDSIQGRAL